MDNIILKVSLLLLKAVAGLPLGALYALSDFMYLVVRYVIRYRRKIIRLNLYNAFPERGCRERRRIEAGYYRHLCDCIVEDVKLLHVSDSEMARRVKVNGAELVDDAVREGHSVIIFLGHYGNWEWVQEICRHYSLPDISAEIYRPAKNKVFNEILRRVRSRYPTVQIPQKKAVRQLLRYNSEGAHFVVGFISDQRPNSRNLNHWTDFLCQDTPYAAGGEDIGNHVGAIYLYLDIEKPLRGHYVFTFKPVTPCDDGGQYPYTRAFLRMLEATIRRDPRYWLWSHNRWKYKRKKQQ